MDWFLWNGLRNNVNVLLVFVGIFGMAMVNSQGFDHHEQHYTPKRFIQPRIPTNKINQAEFTKNYWNKLAQKTVMEHLNNRLLTNVAKNVILFLGDGMSIPTVSAARAYAGQMTGELGESSQLSFEKFPYLGLSKTYCVDKQVADSACTSTAYLCGVKGNYATLGVTASVSLGNCPSMLNVSNHVDSIAKWAQEKGKATGFVTTSRVTHASPAGLYSHTADRSWESDADVKRGGYNEQCPDIGLQLVKFEPGKNFNVIMGGGRNKLLPKTQKDEEGHRGSRDDGVNLIKEWLTDKKKRLLPFTKYVWNRSQLLNVDTLNTEYLLGLFESDHCQYHLNANPETEPTLEEMTKVAIEILSKNSNGYFLFVEGARIDMAHHNNNAKLALDETVEFSKAVAMADRITSPLDTLIVVTADHAHTMSYSGYPDRGNNILSFAGTDVENNPYLTLSYANGPGFKSTSSQGKRYNMKNDDTCSKSYQFPTTVPLVSETHGGDDVAVYARGPWAQLFSGVYEQHVLPHLMAFASCVGNGFTICGSL